MKILETNNIRHSYDNGKEILNGVNIHLNKQEIVSILGTSGSGKTTLFNIISGNITPDSGEVLYHGININGTKGNFSYMLQKDLLFPYYTILENICLPLKISGVRKSEACKLAKSYFKEFGLEGTENLYPHELSGGMRQRAALLRTYLNHNEVILLDEPFSALDMITKDAMHHWFLNVVKEHGISGLFISHDIEEAIFLSNRIYILNKKGTISNEFLIFRPDDSEDFKLSEKFLRYKKAITKAIAWK